MKLEAATRLRASKPDLIKEVLKANGFIYNEKQSGYRYSYSIAAYTPSKAALTKGASGSVEVHKEEGKTKVYVRLVTIQGKKVNVVSSPADVPAFLKKIFA